MRNRQELIDRHWQEAVQIDETMCRTAEVYVEEFLGEKVVLDGRLDRDDWMKYDMPVKYFMYLAYGYALSALGERNLKLRPLVEALVAEVILQASLGDMPTDDSIRDELVLTTDQEFEGIPAEGRERMQLGQEMTRAFFRSRNCLPESYVDVVKSQRMMVLWAISQIGKQLFRKLWKASRESENRDIEAKKMLSSLQKSVKKLGIRFLPMIDTTGWLVEQTKAQ